MSYDAFKGQFLEALRSSGLRLMHSAPTETLDLRSMDRTFKVYVEPPARQRGKRFYVNANISWIWRTSLTARFATTEEDFLAEVVGRDNEDMDTEQPWLRVDVELHAGVDPNAPHFVLPDPKTWSRWVRAVNEQLGGIDQLANRKNADDGFFKSWRGQPEVKMEGSELGHPIVSSIRVSAFELLSLPRHWDDPEREPDDDPYEQLEGLLDRLERAMKVWQDSLELLG